MWLAKSCSAEVNFFQLAANGCRQNDKNMSQWQPKGGPEQGGLWN